MGELLAALRKVMRELADTDAPTPQWRELGTEAQMRGLKRRTFREWCQRSGVAIRDVNGIAYVSPSEVDRVIANGKPRATPPSLVPQSDAEAQEQAEHDRAIDNHRPRRRRSRK